MGTITTKDGTQIYYKDWGKGQPIVFHHGWPLTADDWDNQMMFFVAQGFRVIAHDRRGHGRSSRPAGTRWNVCCRRGRIDCGSSILGAQSISATRPAAAKWRAMSHNTERVESQRRC